MAKARRRRPRNLGLLIVVNHPDSQDSPSQMRLEDGSLVHYGEDSDGHVISGFMDGMSGDSLLEIQVRRGMGAMTAAHILRKVADRIEKLGNPIMNLPEIVAGTFLPDGRFEVAFSGEDDDGELFLLPGEQ